jgi:hypothetical protein
MKRLLPLSLLAFSTLSFADMAQQEFLYKDPRIMGMGGANTAVGGYSTAVFSNPAGLIKIKKSHGIEAELLGIGLTSSANTQKFLDDVSNSKDDEVANTISKYSGDAFNINISNYSSFSYHSESDIAYSFGLLGAADINLIPHSNSGANGILETHSRAYGGLFLASAVKYPNITVPLLDGKLDGVAIRVPTQNVSVVDFKFNSKKETSIEEINEAIKIASENELKNILSFNDKKLVSSDFNHNPSSSIFHSDQTKVMNKKFVRILSWYDNEWGFSNRMCDTALEIGKYI